MIEIGLMLGGAVTVGAVCFCVGWVTGSLSGFWSGYNYDRNLKHHQEGKAGR
jgi:hypothetical protein